MGATGGDASEAPRAMFNWGLKTSNDDRFRGETIPQVSEGQLSHN